MTIAVRRDCKKCNNASYFKREKLPKEHAIREYAENNQEAVAYMAQIQESGNKQAIELAKKLYTAIFEQVEWMLGHGEYKK